MSYRCYPSDLTDAQFARIEHLLANRAPGQRGRPRKYSDREILNGIFYLLRTGGAWRYLPKEYPPWQSVYAYFRRWSEDGTLERMHNALRSEVRRRAGKREDPSAAIVDSQSVKTTEKGDLQAAEDTMQASACRAENATLA